MNKFNVGDLVWVDFDNWSWKAVIIACYPENEGTGKPDYSIEIERSDGSKSTIAGFEAAMYPRKDNE